MLSGFLPLGTGLSSQNTLGIPPLRVLSQQVGIVMRGKFPVIILYMFSESSYSESRLFSELLTLADCVWSFPPYLNMV